MGKPPPLSLVAKALLVMAPAVDASILAMALSQSIGEGAWSAWSEGGVDYYPFDATNNFGAIHATQGFARTFASGGTVTLPGSAGAGAQVVTYGAGWGMVAFLDHNPAPYVARMAVYPSLAAGADAFLGLIRRYVNLAAVKDASDFAAQLYVSNYFEGFHPNRTIVQNRAAAYASGNWSDDDQANIADYASMIGGNLAAAQNALAAAPGETGDPTEATHGPPFAPLGVRLTPSGKVLDHTGALVAGAPHTVERARVILGAAADAPPAGAISLDDALSAPSGDGVWMFPEGASAPESEAPAPPAKVSRRAAEEIGAAGALAGALLGAAAAAAAFRLRPGWIEALVGVRA